MALDYSPLALSHFLLFGGSFLLVFGIFSSILRYTPTSLRLHRGNQRVFFGGVVLIGVMSLIGYAIVDDVRLRIGLLAAAFLTLVVGIVDEQVKLLPSTQFLWQVVIAFIAAAWGWTVTTISNPWGLLLPGAADGVIHLSWFTIGSLSLPGLFLAVVWLVFLMNAINWLDGSDGLAGGVGMVALITLGAVSLLPSIQDGHTLSLAMAGAGATLGFLLWNFPPARVYLGTSGSWFLGLYLGMVAIMGGGKIVTTLLVLALPVLDVMVVVVARLLARQRPWQGDTIRHFHHRLQRAGFQPRTIAFLGMAVSGLLGLTAVQLQTEQKVIAFGVAGGIMLLLLVRLLSVRPLPVAAASPEDNGATAGLRPASAKQNSFENFHS